MGGISLQSTHTLQGGRGESIALNRMAENGLIARGTVFHVCQVMPKLRVFVR